MVFMASCKKPTELEEQGDAIFYFEGKMAGNPIDITAGDNSFFMLTTYSEDALGIKSFNGNLGKISCVGQDECPGQLQISIREKERDSGGSLPIEESITVQQYFFRGPAEYLFTSYKASFISKSSPSGVGHTWDFGDGVQSTLTNPTHYYLNEADSIVTPVLTVSSSGNCSNVIAFPIHFTSGCSVDFDASYNSSIGYLTWTSNPGTGRNELWDFGNGYLPEGPNNLPPSDSIFTTCLASTDVDGCISFKCKNIVLDTQNVHCVANFDVITEVVVTEDIRDFSEVTIMWENESGKKYASTRYAQPENSLFKILVVEDYKNDQDNNPTKKITVQFEVRLFGDSELDYIDFDTERSVFAIAYP